jgi:hypothetical protein
MCPDNLQLGSFLATSPIKLGHQRTTYGGSPPGALDLEHLTTTGRIAYVRAMHRDPITDRLGS